jgi:hypothetical protein
MLRVAPGACGALWSKGVGKPGSGRRIIVAAGDEVAFSVIWFRREGKHEKRGKTLTVDSGKTPPQRRSEYDNASVWTCVL